MGKLIDNPSGGGTGGGSVTSNELSAAAATLSTRINSVQSAVSTAISAIQANSAQMKSADDAISNAVSIVSVAVGVVSADLTSVKDRVSANSATLSNAQSAIQANSAQMTSADNAISNAVSIVSVKVAGVPTQIVKIVSNVQSTAGSAMVDISGLILTLSAGESWQIEGRVLVSTSVATAGLKMGCSVAPLSSPRFIRFDRASTGQSGGVLAGAGQLQLSGTSQFFSAANLGGLVNMVDIKAVLNVASAGIFQIQACGIASTAASPLHIMPGSYLICTKLK